MSRSTMIHLLFVTFDKIFLCVSGISYFSEKKRTTLGIRQYPRNFQAPENMFTPKKKKWGEDSSIDRINLNLSKGHADILQTSENISEVVIDMIFFSI